MIQPSDIRRDPDGYLVAIGSPHGKKPKTYPTGRRCPACNARISIYNPDSVCSPCDRRKVSSAADDR